MKIYNLKFPREVCNPKRFICKDEKEFLNFINSNINATNLYTNVYNFAQFTDFNYPIYESAIIDRIYVDCDQRYKENGEWINCPAYENMLKIHEWCKLNDIKHSARCTGSGYDLIILTNPDYKVKNKKSCISNAQLWLCKELDIQTDKQVVGDISRIHRIDNTFNHKPHARRFCIPLTEDIIYSGEKNIFECANKQNFKKTFYGNKFWDISAFDTADFIYKDTLDLAEIKIDEKYFSDLSTNIPDCVKILLSKKDLNWEERRCVILALRDNQYLFDEALVILQKYLSKKKFAHCYKEEKQIQHLYAHGKYLFPLQPEMIRLSACPNEEKTFCDKCKFGCKLYGR
jgi:hypothetical protein